MIKVIRDTLSTIAVVLGAVGDAALPPSALKAKDAEREASARENAEALVVLKADGEAALKAAANDKALVDGALATANEQIATLQGMVAAAEGRAAKAEAAAAEAVAKAAATAEMERKLASDDRQLALPEETRNALVVRVSQ